MVHDREKARSAVLDVRAEAELVLLETIERIDKSPTALKPPTAGKTLEIAFGEQLHVGAVTGVSTRDATRPGPRCSALRTR